MWGSLSYTDSIAHVPIYVIHFVSLSQHAQECVGFVVVRGFDCARHLSLAQQTTHAGGNLLLDDQIRALFPGQGRRLQQRRMEGEK